VISHETALCDISGYFGIKPLERRQAARLPVLGCFPGDEFTGVKLRTSLQGDLRRFSIRGFSCFASWTRHYFMGFCFTDFRRRTPGPPPFSSMNSPPAFSKARCTTSSVARRDLPPLLFELVDSHDTNACAISQALLTPAK
jgi:hypothetical protein